jgi:hypothetical protein
MGGGVGVGVGRTSIGRDWSHVTTVDTDPPAYENLIVALPARRCEGIETVAEVSGMAVVRLTILFISFAPVHLLL